MNYIGNIIKSYREMLGMSRANLSKDICSEKYVYLIEKGERTPSVDMTRLFSDKMGVNLFDHYQYLDCKNPIMVHEKMKVFRIHRRKYDYLALKRLTDEAADLPDFRREPWVYEIQVNRFTYLIFIEKKYEEAINDINAVLRKVKPKYSKGIYMANFYMLASMCYQITGNLADAKDMTSAANEIIRNKHSINDYKEIITSVGAGTLGMHYMAEEYNEIIQKGKELLQYKSEVNSGERVDYIYFYLAFAYYKTGSQEEAIIWFKKALYSDILEYNPLSVYYMSRQDLFEILLGDTRINPYLISEFKEKYKIG